LNSYCDWLYDEVAGGRLTQSAMGEDIMNLSAPTVPIFLVSVVLFVLALLGHFAAVPILTLYQFWIAILAYVVLAAGALFKGL
jgi:hypothetical protein